MENEKQRQNFKFLQKMCDISEKIIYMDGDISNKTYNFMNSISQNNIIVKNNFQVKKKINVTRNYGKFFNSIVDDIKQKKKLYICCMSSDDSKNYYEKIKAIFSELNILHIYAKMDEKKKNEIFENVNEEWKKYDVIITTPTVESGVSFDVENYFYKCYGVVSPRSTTVRGFLQMIARVRHLGSNDHLIYSERMILNRVNFYTFNDLKKNILSFFDSSEEAKKEFFDSNNKIIEAEEVYIKNFIFNQTEIFNSGPLFFIAYLKLLCKEKGYEFSYDGEKGNEKNEKKFNGKIGILNVPCPSMLDYQELSEKQDIGEDLTEIEKYKIDKYKYFVSTMGYSVSEVKEIEKERLERLKEVIPDKKNKEETKQFKNKYNTSLEAENEFSMCYKKNIVVNFLSLIDIDNMKTVGNLNINENLKTLKLVDIIKDITEFLKIIGVKNITEEHKLKDFKQILKDKKNELSILKYALNDEGKIFVKEKTKDEEETKTYWDVKNFLNEFGCDIMSDRNDNKVSINGKIIYKSNFIFKPYPELINILIRKLKKNKINDKEKKLEYIKNFIEYEYDVFEIFDINIQ
jgi:hypothetical protein